MATGGGAGRGPKQRRNRRSVHTNRT
uniref:Uncharacterized protein n=1 Tax=Anguilla anguilla TaxID=7936 RepID=A0A0E9VQT9_ANGAN